MVFFKKNVNVNWSWVLFENVHTGAKMIPELRY